MIAVFFTTFIGFSSQKMGELCIHHRGMIFTDGFSDIESNHVKKFCQLLLNFLENIYYFRYAYFDFYGTFSFLDKVLVKTLLKEKRPFFYPFRIYTKYFILRIDVLGFIDQCR